MALMHLLANKIGENETDDGHAWHMGNREDFVKRHAKAVAMIREWMASYGSSVTRDSQNPPIIISE